MRDQHACALASRGGPYEVAPQAGAPADVGKLVAPPGPGMYHDPPILAQVSDVMRTVSSMSHQLVGCRKLLTSSSSSNPSTTSFVAARSIAAMRSPGFE
jgi:hypothetical protein